MKSRGPPENLNSALVVGGPRIPSTLSESWGWTESPASLQEAAMVSDMLNAKALVSSNATKGNKKFTFHKITLVIEFSFCVHRGCYL